jgi:branched-chain amino acid transport system ATP-binding protein
MEAKIADKKVGTSVLEISNLEKNFGGVRAIDDFSVDIEQGKIHGLIGPNGAGKTTIFNCITGILTPENGSIFFDAKEITGKKPHIIAQQGIGRTFQNIRLFSNLSVLQNVILAGSLDAKYNMLDAFLRTPRYRRTEKHIIEKSMMLLKSVGLEDNSKEIASKLPYGHQRKLEIARAIALNPKLLLLDEPAAGMNSDESEELVGFIQKIKKNFKLTILMIEHHMDVVTNLCDYVTVLNFGKTIASGTPAEVKRNEHVIEAYLGGVDDAEN